MSTPALTFVRRGREVFAATLGRILAEGGGGVVQEALSTSPAPGAPERLAVKRAKGGSERLLELEREAAESLEHPNLVRFLGAARTAEHGTVLAFEPLAGNPLLLLNGAQRRPTWRDPGTTYYPLPPGRAIELAFDLLLALEYLHARGIVHADVKLANLLVRTPAAHDDVASVLEHVARGAFEGVLIDLGSLRSSAFLAALARGQADPELTPRLTPLYAPPEALFEQAAHGGRKLFSPAMDVYAAGLVLYALLTGRTPYERVGRGEASLDTDAVLELKLREGRGELSPVDERALDSIPLHDVAFHDAVERVWPHFRSAMGHLLRGMLHPDPARRLSASAARAFMEEELLLRPSATSGERPWTQRYFQMRPRANRLVGDRPLGGIRVRATGLRVQSEEAPPPRREASPVPGAAPGAEGESPVPAGRAPATAAKGDGSSTLESLLEDVRAGRPLPLVFPVVVSRFGVDRKDLARSRVHSLGELSSTVKISSDGSFLQVSQLTVGRATTNDIVLEDRTVSKQHLLIERGREGWSVRDLGSSNGTRVNGEALAPKTRHRLEAPATISVGPDVRLAFLGEAELREHLQRALAARSASADERRRERSASATCSLEDRDAARLGCDFELLGAAPESGAFPLPGARTKRIARDLVPDHARPALGPAGGAADELPEDLETRLVSLVQGDESSVVHVVLAGARIESSSDVAEVLEVVRAHPDEVLGISVARKLSASSVTLFSRRAAAS